MLHIAGINYESTADARGVSCVIFFSGCRHYCNGCHSKDTWDFNYGKEATDDLIKIINSEIDKRPFLSSLVLSGGDPMYSASEVKQFISKIHVPKNNIWCYSGFKFEDIQQNKDMKELLDVCNVLIDGKFEIEKRDITLSFMGSSNQRIWRKIDGEWETDNQKQASKICGIPQAHISRLIKDNGYKDGWQFYYIDETTYKDSSSYQNFINCVDDITIRNINTNEILHFNTKKEMSDYFNIKGNAANEYVTKNFTIMHEWKVIDGTNKTN